MASYNQLQRGQIPGQARRSTTIDVPSSLLPISNNGANLRGKYGSNTRIPLVSKYFVNQKFFSSKNFFYKRLTLEYK